QRQPIWHHTMLTAGIGESFLSEQIADIEAALPAHIRLAYLPKPGMVRLRLTATGDDMERLQNETRSIVSQIRQRIGKHFIGDGAIILDSLILNFMRRHGLTLATAESCTGGNIAHLITSIPGSSSVFEGAAVTYSNAVKERLLGVKTETIELYGAVSEETVREMAQGAQQRFQVDYAVAVTGIAGPDGGTAEKSVGLVWIAVAGKNGVTVQKSLFGQERNSDIERASMAALFMLWECMNAVLDIR